MSTITFKKNDVIRIGRRDAVICAVRNLEQQIYEVVYLDDRKRAINEDVRWNGDEWEFVYQSVCGGYADKYDRLATYVYKLKSL